MAMAAAMGLCLIKGLPLVEAEFQKYAMFLKSSMGYSLDNNGQYNSQMQGENAIQTDANIRKSTS